MTSLDQRLTHLLQQIHQGQGELALSSIDDLLKKHPQSLGLMTLRAEALRSCGKDQEAIEAYQKAAQMGAPEHNWVAAGILLSAQRRVDEALVCLNHAHAATPNNPQVLDAYITTLFNNNRYFEGIDYARQQLNQASQALYLSNAALLLQSCDLYEEASEAFKKIHRLEPDNHAVLGPALVAARFTCEWEWIEYLQQRILECYAQEDFNGPQEYPLTHLTWCSDERLNQQVTQAYVQRMVPRAKHLTPSPLPEVSQRRIRVGYISCDFRNHATLHLMMGLLESHQRSRFEIFAYDFTVADDSAYRQRFLRAIEHHVNIEAMTDEQAAQRIAQDRLDVLIDLKLYTGGSRAGILAYRPAPLQVAYLGFPGSAACEDLDYIISDTWVTPDSSRAFYSEKLCRLPHSYQCNDQMRLRPQTRPKRSEYGLRDDQVVFAAFNQSYKIDRLSFSAWMQVLHEVPHSVLWLLGQSDKAQSQLLQEAQAAGVSPQRLVFAPFVEPEQHLARLPLADAMLDTLVCNGHTTTSDALWMGVPVITRKGQHFASRVSESLLRAVHMPQLIGDDTSEMIQIAKRIGLDAAWRQQLRDTLSEHIASSPLFDTLGFTQNFERALTLMVERHQAGLPPDHIDLVDQPVAACTTAHLHCPICESTQIQAIGQTVLQVSDSHALALPKGRTWMHCTACAHRFVKDYWNQAAWPLLEQSLVAPDFFKEVLLQHDARRVQWSPHVEHVIQLCGGYDAQRIARTRWLDVGCADASLVMTARDYGFDAQGIDLMPRKIDALKTLDVPHVKLGDWLTNASLTPVDILSLHNVLECLAQPIQALKQAHRSLSANGLLVISMPDVGSSSWHLLEKTGANPYWSEPEIQHLLSRSSLIDCLDKTGFQVVDIRLPTRFKAQMEVYARKR